MIRNEYVYELSAAQIATFDLDQIADLITLRNPNQGLTFVNAGHAYLTELMGRFPSCVGASLFSLTDHDAVLHCHDDLNLLDLEKSRQSALNFVVSPEQVVYEW